MLNYTVITDKGGGPNQIYHDVEGEIYTFPKQYKDKLNKGTVVIYHRTKKDENEDPIPNRLSDESHYFGVAKIGEVQETEDGNFRASIVEYRRFTHPVSIWRPKGTPYEINPVFQQGVRATNKEVFDEIVKASQSTAVVHQNRQKGPKSVKSLNVGISSRKFWDEKYQIVTGSDGYYLYNCADGIYYKLKKLSSIPYNTGKLSVMDGSCRLLIIHKNVAVSEEIGILKPIDIVIHFSSTIDNKQVEIDIYL